MMSTAKLSFTTCSMTCAVDKLYLFFNESHENPNQF